ncbi:MAG: ABC transporter ATP-binding protein [Devosia sp.]
MLNSTATEPLLQVRDLSVVLQSRSTRGFAVDGVSYSLMPAETLAIVGESGSGKTVTNMAPLGLMPPAVLAEMRGSVMFKGRDLLKLSEPELRAIRGKEIGVIFQDPLSALNPARTVGRQLTEMGELHRGLTPRAAEEAALDLLKMTGLSEPAMRLRQYPHELSGGMRQRVVIAIAIASEPALLIADEPTTALDMTVQAQIVQLIKDIQRRLGMALVLITHDIGVVAGMADTLVVMYAGRMAEHGPAPELLRGPRHPYTQGLLNSLPRTTDAPGSEFRGIAGTPPSVLRRVPGCPFASRCPRAFEPCPTSRPPDVRVSLGHGAACFAVAEQERRIPA